MPHSTLMGVITKLKSKCKKKERALHTNVVRHSMFGAIKYEVKYFNHATAMGRYYIDYIKYVKHMSCET